MTRRGTSRDGLFRWLADGEVAVDEVTANPLLVACPVCGAGIRQSCRQPSRHRGGHLDRDPHPSRIDAAGATGAAVDQASTTALPPSVHAQPPRKVPR
jgi:hypothetical protein